MSQSETYKMLVEALGEELSQKLCRAFGGQKIYVPAEPREASPIADFLNYGEFRELCAAFGGERLFIPLGLEGRRERAMAALRSGSSVKEVARAFGYTARAVERLRRQM